MEDARRPNQFTRKSCQMDTVFTEDEIIPHIRSIIRAVDGEVVSFHNSDSSDRVDGDRLGQ